MFSEEFKKPYTCYFTCRCNRMKAEHESQQTQRYPAAEDPRRRVRQEALPAKFRKSTRRDGTKEWMKGCNKQFSLWNKRGNWFRKTNLQRSVERLNVWKYIWIKVGMRSILYQGRRKDRTANKKTKGEMRRGRKERNKTEIWVSES